MGYMTVISILNDGFETIKKNKDEFIENIEKGIIGKRTFPFKEHSVNSYPVGNHCNPMQVAKSFHADMSQVFYVGQNTMTMLTDWNTEDKDSIEFQLKRIKSAKKLLNATEKELKEKLEQIKEFKVGMNLTCNSDFKIYKKGKTYKIDRFHNESYCWINGENEETMLWPVLNLYLYFDIEK